MADEVGGENAPAVTAGDIEALIRRIVASGAIVEDSRQFSLLSYLVKQELAGEGARTKAFSVALDVFHLGDDFDASTNSIVRVEMHRLRKALDLYGATAGRDDPFIIVLDKGSYRPRFVAREKAPDAGAPLSKLLPTAGWAPSPRLLLFAGIGVIGAFAVAIMASTSLGVKRSCANPRPSLSIALVNPAEEGGDLFKIFSSNLSSMLSRYPLVVLVDPKSRACPSVPAYRAVFEPMAMGDERVISAQLTLKNTPEPVWSEDFPISATPNIEELTLIVSTIAYRLANSDGVIPVNARGASWSDAAARSDYECIMDAHVLFETESAVMRQPIMDCLKAMTAKGTPYADVYGVLAAVEYYIFRGYWSGDETSAKQEFERLLAAGAAIDPLDREVLINKLRVARDARPIQAEEIRRLRTLIMANASFDPHLLNQLARSDGLGLGDWESAAALSTRAIRISGGNHLIDMTAYSSSIAFGDWDRARRFMEANKYANITSLAVLNLAVALRFNDAAVVRDAVSALKSDGYASYDSVVALVNSFYGHAALSAPLLEEIAKLTPAEYAQMPVVVKPQEQ